MRYAEMAVNSPGSGRHPFCYAIPSSLSIEVGQAVWVPFGSQVLQGIVLKLSDYPSVEQTKEIAGIISYEPLLSPTQVGLALWLSDYYLCPLFEAVALMLPPGFERKVITFFQAVPFIDETALSRLTSDQIQTFNLIKAMGKVSLKQLGKKLGKEKAKQVTGKLLRQRLIMGSRELEKDKVKPKFVSSLQLALSLDEAKKEIDRLKQKRAHKQAEIIEFLVQYKQPALLPELREFLSATKAAVEALKRRRIISVTQIEIKRDPLSRVRFVPASLPVLTPAQEKVWQRLRDSLNGGESKVFLLFGVTGSGKTEIYLRALADVVAKGKRGLCLVPEIALTPQTIERFMARFPGRVGVFHSGLSLGEQFDEWHQIRRGAFDVVIGPRGALFTPQPDLGLIIIDEEHEWSYKQQDKSPRYHARDVAIKLAELTGAVVILGSATPDVETFYRAQQGKYQLLELPERITPRGLSPLPVVEIVDLKEELKAGNTSLFSRSLAASIKETLVRGEQVILFLNRRGTATFVQCRSCGFAIRCPRCTVALTYHSVGKRLICHRCRYSIPVPQSCPRCLSRRLKFLGIGTQRVEEEMRQLFPKAHLLRWDKDVVTKRRFYDELLADFRSGKANVLIGTQMIAKGLHLPEVTLAGVISADIGLNLPDFRAGERTFQLLCQVAGRAGRGLGAGKVIIQTYSPGHYAVQAASTHDYLGFHSQEIEYRRQFDYPPFSCFVRLLYGHTNSFFCQEEIKRVSQLLLTERDKEGIPDLSLIGPIPAFISRIRGRYWWQIIVRGTDPAKLIARVDLPKGWIIDVDPVGLV